MSFPLTRLGKSGFQIVNIENTTIGSSTCLPVFVGWAPPGSADSDPAWVIAELTYDGGGCLETLRYATESGDPIEALSYDKIWDDRATYVYV